MACRNGCGTAASFSDAVCLKGVNALEVCGDGVPSEQGGAGCYTVRLRTANTDTVTFRQFEPGSSALKADVRVGRVASNATRVIDDVGIYTPDIVSADGCISIKDPSDECSEDVIGFKEISLNVSTRACNGIECLSDESDPTSSETNGLYIQEWVHEMFEVVGTADHVQPVSVQAVDDARAANGTSVQLSSVDALDASYTNTHSCDMLVKFEVYWGGSQIRAIDTAQVVSINHVASMNFGAISDIASNSEYGRQGNASIQGTGQTVEINFPRSASAYVTTLPPSGTASITVFNTIASSGPLPAGQNNAWSAGWGAPRIVVTALSKRVEDDS